MIPSDLKRAELCQTLAEALPQKEPDSVPNTKWKFQAKFPSVTGSVFSSSGSIPTPHRLKDLSAGKMKPNTVL